MAHMICTKCGTEGKPTSHTKGSILIEIVLWICCIVPGVIYSVWRLTTRSKVCRTCGSADLVPTSSPVGRQLKAKFSAN